MDSHFGIASREDLWRLQNEMKNVYATQAEHADRLARLEQRQDSDSRAKTPWGVQSPYPAPFNGTPQQDPGYNPAAEAFRNFDQDQPSSLMGSLHLDAEDEPRRGTSRANSVRFDERALQGAFGHGSRSSTDFLPLRTGSAFGSHPLTERSSSHKSDGRQSSAGQSIHSARASSYGPESRPLSATVPSFVPLGPPPGLFILGPVPSIIRCWLTDDFTNDSLLYAAVCTASYKSVMDLSLVSSLGYEDRIITSRDGQRCIKLPVYFPEATIQQSSTRSNSPAHQLPMITSEFVIRDLRSSDAAIQIFLGCDILRSHNADIHFSLDRLTLLDDERNKLSVPLVRPENVTIYQSLQTAAMNNADSTHSVTEVAEQAGRGAVDRGEISARHLELQGIDVDDQPEESEIDNSGAATMASPSVIGDGRPPMKDQRVNQSAPSEIKAGSDSKEPQGLHNGSTFDSASRTENNNNVWGSWRRDSDQGNRVGSNNSSASGYQRAGRGRGMKVLKPTRLSTSRSSSAHYPLVGMEAAVRSSSSAERLEDTSPATERRGVYGETRPPLASATNKSRSANPIGGASAFGWLNSGGGKASAQTSD